MVNEAPSSGIAPEFSVVVPVYEDWHMVPALIDCFARQHPTPPFEVIFVDNASSSVPGKLALPAFAAICECEKPGSYSARNMGISQARGKYLAFTDADCRPCPQWLDQARHAFQKYGDRQVIIAGVVAVTPECADGPLPPELYDMLLGMPQREYVGRGYGITANLFVPRAVFERFGGFDEVRFSGADAEFCRRASRGGVRVRYCAAAFVEHPARKRFDELAKKKRRVKGGQITRGSIRRRALYTIRTFLPPLRAWRKVWRADGYTPRQKASVMLTQARLWWVEMLEVVRLLCGGVPRRS